MFATKGGCMILFSEIVLTLLWGILIFVVAYVVVFLIAMIVHMGQMMKSEGG
jgi:hypothetical protein